MNSVTILQEEIAYRESLGMRRVTIKAMNAEFMALGYRLDRSLDCRGLARWQTGARAGKSHPAITTGVKESDSGRSAFHFESRRDSNFEAMQRLRQDVFAVSRGAIFEA